MKKRLFSKSLKIPSLNDGKYKKTKLPYEDFESEYYKNSRSLESKVKLIEDGLKEIVSLTNTLTFFYAALAIYLLFLSRREIELLEVILYFYIISGIILVVANQYGKRKLAQLNTIPTERLKKISAGSVLELDAIITDLCKVMNISKSSIVVWKTDSHTYYPSIQRYKGRHNLFLPKSFFKLLYTKKCVAKTLLAHEFGHILQKDTQLWMYSIAYYRVIKSIHDPILFGLLIFLGYSVIVGTFSFLFGLKEISKLPVLIGKWYLLWNCTETRKKSTAIHKIIDVTRKESEKLADSAAMIFADKDCLTIAIEKYSIDSEEMIHPPRKDRLSYIKFIEERYDFT